MRKILLSIVAIVAVAFSASAQQKGESYFGINLDYDTSKTWSKVTVHSAYVDDKDFEEVLPGGDNFGMGLEYGIFVADNLLLKAHIGYGFDKAGDDISHSLNITPGLAYYVRLAHGFYYTPNISVGYGMSMTKQSDNSYLAANGLVAEFQPLAVEFRPTERFAMTVSLSSLQYVFLTTDTELLGTPASMDVSALSFSLLKNAQVGFKFYF